MSSKDIWYGVLEAGEKTSPVVRDTTLDASHGKIWLYNLHRNQFIEYASAIVEPKLRELTTGDIPQAELDKAFTAAHKVFSSTHKIDTSFTPKAAARPVRKKDEDEENEEEFDIDVDVDIADEDDAEELDDVDD